MRKKERELSMNRSAELQFGAMQILQHADLEIGAPFFRDANTGVGQDFTGLADF